MLHPHTTYVYVCALEYNLLSSLEQIQASTVWPKMSTSSLTPFRSTSRSRISSVRKQLRSLELLQQLTTHNGFFQQLQTKWKRLRGHNINKSPTWLFQDEQPAPAQIITTWLREIMLALDLHTPPGVSYTGHSLRHGGASAAHSSPRNQC